MNQLHQIALYNPNDVAALLQQKYGLPVPENPIELAQAVDYAYDQFGNTFSNDLNFLQIQKNIIANQEIAFKQKLDSSNQNQLKEEIIRLDVKLRQSQTLEDREYFLDKIAYCQKLLLQKVEIGTPTNENKVNKQNQMLLLGLTALALMFIGSKIFKQ